MICFFNFRILYLNLSNSNLFLDVTTIFVLRLLCSVITLCPSLYSLTRQSRCMFSSPLSIKDKVSCPFKLQIKSGFYICVLCRRLEDKRYCTAQKEVLLEIKLPFKISLAYIVSVIVSVYC
jgi:hypothetical protein